MSEQAAQPATRKYVILEGQTGGPEGRSDIWAKIGTVSAPTREKALEVAAGLSEEWEAGLLVAIPEGAWVPKPVRVQTQRNVTIG